jgi:hypothetical protein
MRSSLVAFASIALALVSCGPKRPPSPSYGAPTTLTGAKVPVEDTSPFGPSATPQETLGPDGSPSKANMYRSKESNREKDQTPSDVRTDSNSR